MIQITVKTLDAIDRSFDVSGDLSIKQFKEQIASTVNIDAASQRLIYHGRVLQDDKILNALDLDGKTLHLVQRLPNQSSELPQHNVVPNRTEISEQQIVVGSVIVPVGNLDTQNFVDSINRILNRLGEVGRRAVVNVGSQNADESVEVNIILRDEPGSQVLESPAFARLHHVEHVLSHINQSLFHLEHDELHEDRDDHSGCERKTDQSNKTSADVEPKFNDVETTNQNDAESSSNTDLRGVERSANQPSAGRPTPIVRDASVAYYASVFERVQRLQERLRPHMQRYLSLLENEQDYSSNESAGRRDSSFFNCMQIIFHNVGHVYHALSDLNIHFCRPLPRFVEPMAVRQPNSVIQAPEAHITVRFVRATDAEAYQQFEQLFNMGSGAPLPAVTGAATQRQQPNVTVQAQSGLQRPSVPASQGAERPQTSVFQRFFNNLLPGASANVPQGQHVQIPMSQGTAQTVAATNQFSTIRAPIGRGMGVQLSSQPLVLPTANHGVVVRVPRTLLGATPNLGPMVPGPFPQQPGFPAPAALAVSVAPPGPMGQITMATRPMEQTAQSLPQFTFNQSAQRSPQPLFNVDTFLPCSSRHFDPRNRQRGLHSPQRQAANGATPAQPSQASAPGNSRDIDEETLDLMEFENTMERLLRSTLDAMRTRPVSVSPTVHVGIHAQTANPSVPQAVTARVVVEEPNAAAPLVSHGQPAENAPRLTEAAPAASVAENREPVDNTAVESNAGSRRERATSARNVNEGWKSQVPEDWVSVIETDVERQRCLPPQPAPFSDAYLNGMPLKRRKMINDKKPNFNVDLSKLVDQAAEKSGQESGMSHQQQSSSRRKQPDEDLVKSFEENLKDKIRSRAHTDSDFDHKRYANIDKLLSE